MHDLVCLKVAHKVTSSSFFFAFTISFNNHMQVNKIITVIHPKMYSMTIFKLNLKNFGGKIRYLATKFNQRLKKKPRQWADMRGKTIIFIS